MEEPERDMTATRLAGICLDYNDLETFRYLLNTAPFATNRPKIWQHVDFSKTEKDFLAEILNVGALGATAQEIEQVTRQSLEQSIDCVTAQPPRTQGEIRQAIVNMTEFANQLAPYATAEQYERLTEKLSLMDQKDPNAILLISLLNHGSQLWGSISRPDVVNRFRSKNTRLYKKYGKDITDVFSSWR